MGKVYGEVNPQTIWSNPPEQIHYDVADWALAGNKLPGWANAFGITIPTVQRAASTSPNRYRQICNPCQPALFLQTY